MMETIKSFGIKKISPVLLVSDLQQAIGFYTAMLGFEIEFVYDDFYAGIVKNGNSIHLKTGWKLSEEQKNKRKNDDVDLVFSVDNIETIYEELKGKGVTIIQPLRMMDYAKEFYIADPDGYVLSFLE